MGERALPTAEATLPLTMISWEDPGDDVQYSRAVEQQGTDWPKFPRMATRCYVQLESWDKEWAKIESSQFRESGIGAMVPLSLIHI